MKILIITLAALATQASLPPPPLLNLEQKAGVRCATAFALVTALQDNGGAREFQRLGQREKEFFVRTTARIMDETGATREQIEELIRREIDNLSPEALNETMPACLLMLEASGL